MALLLAGFAAGIAARNAFAQPNGSTIYACKGERSGTVRLVNGPNDCTRGEVLVTWNTVGPVGPQGPQGATGYTFQEVVGPTTELSPGEVAPYSVQCPEGTVALSGGWNTATEIPVIAVIALQSQRSVSNAAQWEFVFYNADDDAVFLTPTLSVVCAVPAM